MKINFQPLSDSLSYTFITGLIRTITVGTIVHLGAVLFSRLLRLQQRRAVPFCRISLFRMKMTEGTMAACRKRIQMKTVSWMLPSDTSGTSQ